MRRVATIFAVSTASVAWLLVSFGALMARSLDGGAGTASPALPLALAVPGVVALTVAAWALYRRLFMLGVAALVIAAALFVIWAAGLD